MKKRVWIWAVVIGWILSVMPAKADAIWEPNDNFYHEHHEECQYVNRNFTANGPDGEVIVYKSPENPKVVDTWENGFKAYISFVYTDEDGNEWGIYENYETDVMGWVPMAYMKVVYDGISFAEEFGESFVEESGVISEEYAGQILHCFDYPGAKSSYEFHTEGINEMPPYQYTFTDEQGLEWGYVGYFYGVRRVWICISNPTATFEELYPDGAPVRGEEEVQETPATQEGNPEENPAAQESNQDESGAEGERNASDGERIEPKRDGGLIGLVIALVVAVTGATGGALAWLKKSKK